MSNNEKSMTDKVIEWIAGQGYPLEMRVARALRHVGFSVRQSEYYLDVESGKSREIDVIASKIDRRGMREIHFLVECKMSKKPWVLLTSAETLTNFQRTLTLGISSNKALQVLNDSFEACYRKEGTLGDWYRKEGQSGYNLRCAFADGEDGTFSAAYGVVKACMSLLKFGATRNPSVPFIFTFPAIVIDSSLFECFLDDNGDICVREIDQGWLFFKARLAGFAGTCIQIVSGRALAAFGTALWRVGEELTELSESSAEVEWELFMKGGHLDV